MTQMALPGVGDPGGCESCPLDGASGVRKMLGRVHGRPYLLWLPQPSVADNLSGRFLDGPSGAWLRRELVKAGIPPKLCDAQYGVRCLALQGGSKGVRVRKPNAREIRCCNAHTRDAVARSKAKAWIFLGTDVARMVANWMGGIGTVWWRDGIRLVIADHPDRMVRGAPPERIRRFRRVLESARRAVDGLDRPGDGFSRFVDVVQVRTASQAEEAVQAIRDLLPEGGRLAVDEESDLVDGRTRTLCVGFCPVPGKAWVFWQHHADVHQTGADRLAVRDAIRTLLDWPCGKAMHHGAYDDGRFLTEFGARARNFDCDTQYGSWMQDPVARRYGLAAVVGRNWPELSGYKTIVEPEVSSGGKGSPPTYGRVPADRLALYNGLDCHATKLIEEDIRDRVPRKLVRVYTRASIVLDAMEDFGPLLDFKELARLERHFPVVRDRLADELKTASGDPNFNPNSWKQVAGLVYGTWGLDTPDGNRGTGADRLRELHLLHGHDGLKTLIDYRRCKSRAERMRSFRTSAEAHAGRVTTRWHLTGTITGRLASGGGGRSDLVNLQNIPSDAHVKNALVSDLRWREFRDAARRSGIDAAIREHGDMEIFLARDYAQMEIRILAQMTGEQVMLRMFREGRDTHASIGALWSEWDYQTLRSDPKARRVVKGMHFGIIYGLGAAGLQRALKLQGVDMPHRKVRKLMDAYWARFKAVSRYRARMPRMAKAHGYVENMFGFRMPVEPGRTRARWQNVAVNAPIQGAAHQVLLSAVALLHANPERYASFRPQMEIHDSLIVVARLDRAAEAVERTRQLLEGDARKFTAREFGIRWRVPLETDLQVGFRFGALADCGSAKDLHGALGRSLERSDRLDREFDALRA